MWSDETLAALLNSLTLMESFIHGLLERAIRLLLAWSNPALLVARHNHVVGGLAMLNSNTLSASWLGLLTANKSVQMEVAISCTINSAFMLITSGYDLQ